VANLRFSSRCAITVEAVPDFLELLGEVLVDLGKIFDRDDFLVGVHLEDVGVPTGCTAAVVQPGRVIAAGRNASPGSFVFPLPLLLAPHLVGRLRPGGTVRVASLAEPELLRREVAIAVDAGRSR